jgi:filamentous hemagglutinin
VSSNCGERKNEVDDAQILVPVLYLARADNRLAPRGGLIAGNNPNLIAGEDLLNAGAPCATNNLSANSSNDLSNSGLIGI